MLERRFENDLFQVPVINVFFVHFPSSCYISYNSIRLHFHNFSFFFFLCFRIRIIKTNTKRKRIEEKQEGK